LFHQTLVVHNLRVHVLDAAEKMYKELGSHHLLGLDGVGYDDAVGALILSFGNAAIGPLKMVRAHVLLLLLLHRYR
jgi:hypothetical protein